MKNPVQDKKSASRHVIKGGEYLDPHLWVLLGNRSEPETSYRGKEVGFRIVRNKK
jgi:hypothetical protein